MTSLPETLVQFRIDLERAIGREQSAGRRQRRRRMAVLVAAAVIVIVGAASAFATVQGLFVVEEYAYGRVSRSVDGVRFSLMVPGAGWENGPHERAGDEFRTRSFLISRNTVGTQGAEAVIFWTAFPDGGEAAACSRLLSPAIGRSAADLANGVANAPGAKLVSGPTRVTLGGRPAQHVVVTVRRDVGCDPGFFFAWRDQMWGAFWPGTDVGDTVRMWIVAVAGTRLVIEAETKQSLGTPAERAHVERDIARIVGSIRFG